MHPMFSVWVYGTSYVFLIFIFHKENKNTQITQLKFICYLFVCEKIMRNMRVMLKCCIFAHIYELAVILKRIQYSMQKSSNNVNSKKTK